MCVCGCARTFRLPQFPASPLETRRGKQGDTSCTGPAPPPQRHQSPGEATGASGSRGSNNSQLLNLKPVTRTRYTNTQTHTHAHTTHIHTRVCTHTCTQPHTYTEGEREREREREREKLTLTHTHTSIHHTNTQTHKHTRTHSHMYRCRHTLTYNSRCIRCSGADVFVVWAWSKQTRQEKVRRTHTAKRDRSAHVTCRSIQVWIDPPRYTVRRAGVRRSF